MVKPYDGMGEPSTYEGDPGMSQSNSPGHHKVIPPILVTLPDHGEITIQAALGQVYFIDAMAPDLAQFDRDGGSLVVHQPYGGAVVLQDFLTLTGSTFPPALTLSDGVLIQADEITRRIWGGYPENGYNNSGANGRTRDGANCFDGIDLFGAGNLDIPDEDDFDFPTSKGSAPDPSSGGKARQHRLSSGAETSGFDLGRELEPETSHVATKIVLGLDDDDDGDVVARPVLFDS